MLEFAYVKAKTEVNDKFCEAEKLHVILKFDALLNSTILFTSFKVKVFFYHSLRMNIYYSNFSVLSLVRSLYIFT